jgi:hypothetical protein
MEEDFKGSRGWFGINKCKNDEKIDTKTKKCVKKTKNEMKNNYLMKFIIFIIFIIFSIYFKFWLLLLLIIFIFILVIFFYYDSIINAFS